MSYLEDDHTDIIKKAKAGLGISTETLAKKTLIPEDRLNLIESGSSIPTQEETMKIAEVLQLEGSRLWEITTNHWRPAPIPLSLTEGLLPIHGDVGGYGVNSYIVFDTETKDGILFDTACNPKAIFSALKGHGIRLKAIFLTHLHGDHIGWIEKIIKNYPVDIYSGGQIGGTSLSMESIVRDGERYDFGRLSIGCISTPGHTPDSFCYKVDGMCFVGDTMFAGSIGRSNPPSMYKIHLKSIREKILSLSEDTILLPGHGPATTVREEKEHNPFLA